MHRLLLGILVAFFITADLYAEPNGAVLYRLGKRLGTHKVPGTAEHHYFGYLEGPAWENKYSSFRFYIDKDDRNALDITGKYKEEAILQHFVDTTVDEHKDWPWGTDILKVNSSMGIGSFRLLNNNTWINPQIPETVDSLVVTIKDSSVQTPKILVAYYGWNIGSGSKINAFWTISTTLDERPTHCELAITGDFTGKVVVGMVNHKDNTANPNRSSIKLIQDQDPPLLATLGKQCGLNEGFADTLLAAIFTDKSYFDSFIENGTINHGMVLKPDADKKVSWSVAFSWAREADPLFRKADWKQLLRGTTGTAQKMHPVVRNAAATVLSSAPEYYTVSGQSIKAKTSPSPTAAKGICIVRTGGKSAVLVR